MVFMTWNEQLKVGIDVIDDDHRKLVELINELHDGMMAGCNREALGSILDRLVSYTRLHFAREEEFFARTGYLDAAHKKAHADLMAQMIDLTAKFKGELLAAPSPLIMDFLKDWLNDHILGSDKKCAAHLNSMGIN